ncbi:MAG: helix-turn-helix transcriptional regulator [Clostridiaceae bacterium]|nr:helix-turn-helix transcriptional regulator [Clostridiaceae bacterium]
MNRIGELRRELGLKQVEFCKEIGVSQAALSGYETGKYQPDNDILVRIANRLNVSTDYLLGKTDIKKAPSYEDAGLSAEEAELLKRFRNASPALQNAALRVLEADLKKESD